MGNYNRDNKFGGGQGGGGKFGGGKDFGQKSYFGNKDSEKPTMHRATCDECGNSCQVPFKPMGSKPVYCSDCFKAMNGGERPERRDSRDSGKSFGNKSFGGPKSFGNKSFGANKSYSSSNSFKPAPASSGISSQQYEMLNVKLDKIMKMLSSALNPEKMQIAEGAQSEPMMESAMEAVVKIEDSEKPKAKKRAKAKKE